MRNKLTVQAVEAAIRECKQVVWIGVEKGPR